MARIAARPFNLQLCAALGLDPLKVRSITLRCRAHDMPVVEVEQLVPIGDAGAVIAELQRYTLTPMDEEKSWPAR